MSSSPERTMRARIAAYARSAKHDGPTVTAAARSAAWQKYLDEVDPTGALPEGERIRRAQALRKSRLLSAALKSAKARRLRKARHVQRETP
jgi:hypothetical protein